jgi:sugar lactone lactonase YvrE
LAVVPKLSPLFVVLTNRVLFGKLSTIAPSPYLIHIRSVFHIKCKLNEGISGVKTIGRILIWGIGGLIALIVVFLVIVRLTLGSGEHYEDLSTEPLLSKFDLEVVAIMDMPLGNPAIASDGRVFFNLHPLANPEGATVFEWVDGQALPYPSETFQANFFNVLGMYIDGQNRLWTLDYASGDSPGTRLIAIDLDTNEVVYDHIFSEVYDNLNDLQVSPDGRTIFFSDPGFPIFGSQAIVVYDIETGETRRVLQGDTSVSADNWIVQTDNGDLWLVPGLVLFKLGVDGIALSKDGQWLYYGGVTHDTLYRIRTKDLLDENLSDEELAGRIQQVGRKPLSDGLSADLDDNIYITDVEHNGIARMSPDGKLQTLVRDERIRWADGISFGPHNRVCFTDSAIPTILENLLFGSVENIKADGPYHLFCFQSDVAGVPGG